MRRGITFGCVLALGAGGARGDDDVKEERAARDRYKSDGQDFKETVKKKVWRGKPTGGRIDGSDDGEAARRVGKGASSDESSADEGAADTVPELHTVEAGDTLWDLCAKFLQNPYYWPRVWSYNPAITNPHWIYPGEEIRFRPGENHRARVVLEGREAKGSSDWRTFNRGAMSVDIFTLRNVAILDEKDIQTAGSISNSFSEKHMVSPTDEVYVTFKDLSKVRVGDQFSLVRLDRELKHPVTNKRAGYFVRIAGDLRILAVSKSVAKAVIGNAYDWIERNHKVVPLINNRLVVRPSSNKAEVKGYVLATFNDEALIADQQVVMLDKGTAEKLERGNKFTIVRKQDGALLRQTKKTKELLPFEDIAEVMLVAVYDKMSVGIVTRSRMEIEPGDLAETRVDRAKASPLPERAIRSGILEKPSTAPTKPDTAKPDKPLSAPTPRP